MSVRVDAVRTPAVALIVISSVSVSQGDLPPAHQGDEWSESGSTNARTRRGVARSLQQRGVVFEEYDMPGITWKDGIATGGGAKTAWFKDTEGNILAIAQKL
jgi:hypothetical protein